MITKWWCNYYKKEITEPQKCNSNEIGIKGYNGNPNILHCSIGSDNCHYFCLSEPFKKEKKQAFLGFNLK